MKKLFLKLLHNWELKLLAAAMASLTFYIIRGKTSVEVHYDIPLNVQVEQGIAILEQTPRTVNVTFRGSQQDLRTLDQSSLRAVVRLKASDTAGSEEVTLTRRNVEGATGVVPVEIRPSRAIVTFDREGEKTLPLPAPVIKGRPLQGRVEIDYEPKIVTLRGPRRRLAAAKAFLEPVDVEGRTEDFSTAARVLAGDPWITEISPPQVTVKVSIRLDIVTRRIEAVRVLPLLEDGNPSKVVLEPAHVTVVIGGQAELVDSVVDGSVRAFVDCVGLSGSAQYDLPVNVHIPSMADISVSAEPSTVKVLLGPR